MAVVPTRPRGRGDFRTAIICALPFEAEMVELVLDHHWAPSFGKAIRDNNVYTTGVLSGHNVVLCYMSGMGGNSAAACAASLCISFPRVEVAFVVGVCGVVPKNPHTGEDIVLGDCIISTAVTQYDFGHQYPNGFSTKTSIDDSLGRASPEIRAMIAKLSTRLNTRKLRAKMITNLQDLQQRESDLRDPGIEMDHLFSSEYDHGQHLPYIRCKYCNKDTPGACPRDCADISCDLAFTITRSTRDLTRVTTDGYPERHPRIHFGRFGSANMVVKAGIFRDKIAIQHDVVAFEMEGAGTWDLLPTIVIKGACDYADSHKNKRWQHYAAVVAASCLKAILASWESSGPENEPPETQKTAELSLHQNFPLIQDNSPQSLATQKRQSILRELNFVGANDRVNHVKVAHSATCHWLLEHKSYLDWLDDSQYSQHHAILWIKGHAGSGKSTIMKKILTEATNLYDKGSTKQKMHQKVIISFFFNAGGNELERSTMGLYRSLLFQLFTLVPEMQEILDTQVLHHFSNSYSDEYSYKFHLQILESILCSAMQWISRSYRQIKKHFSVMCFVDALDECPEDQVRKMVGTFERLGSLSASKNGDVLFRVCFSSRHYPAIFSSFGQELILDKQPGHIEDISKYIDAELRLGTSSEAQSIKAELIEKSGHIFLWVVLVVQILVKEYDKGRIHAMRKKLREIPEELNEVFKDIITRDKDNVEEFMLCIQLMLYANEQLTISEFYFAMLWGIDPSNPTLRCPTWKAQVELEVMQRYLINSSKGLAEVATESNWVQFVHESVGEFFMKEQVLVNSWIGNNSISGGSSHDRLKSMCQQQFNSLVATDSPDEEWLFDFPFLTYAVNNVAWHADQACYYGISPTRFLKDFPSQNWLELQARLNSDGYTLGVSSLYILADQNLSHLIHHELIHRPDCDQPGLEKHELPIYAALANGHTAAVMALLKLAPSPEFDHLEYERAVSSAHFVFENSYPRRGQSLIQWFTEYRPNELAQFLLSCPNWVDHQDPTSLLHLAMRYDDFDVVKKILQHEKIRLDICDYEGCTPLYVAVCGGHTIMAQNLLECNAPIEKGLVKGIRKEPPLLAAIRHGHEEIFQILIDRNADICAVDETGLTALHLAGYKGNVVMVENLLRLGSSIVARNNNGWLPFHVAAFHGSHQVLHLMLNHTTSIDEPTTIGGYTALWLAAMRGYDTCVRWLISKKATIDAFADGNWTPFHAAIFLKHHNTAQLLLQAGANEHADVTGPIRIWPSSEISDSSMPLMLWDWIGILRLYEARHFV